MARTLIGYAVTNSNGVASLTYTGQGVGEMEVTAETGGEVYFGDFGVTDNKNTNWYTNSYGTKSVGANGTTLTSNDSTNFLMYSASDTVESSSRQYIWNDLPYTIEFDVVSQTGSSSECQFQIYSNDTSKAFTIGLTSTGHYKIELGSTRKAYLNGTELTPIQNQTGDMTNVRVTLRVKNSATLTFKNFFIYRGGTQLTSDPIQLLDCQFYQKGTSEPPENTWNISGFTSSYSSNGTTLTSTTFATCFANLVGTGANVYDWNSPVAIEFDIVNFSSTNADFQIYDETNNVTKSFSALSISNGSHIKILVESNQIRYFIDGTEMTGAKWTGTIGTFRCGLRATGTITFKEFKIYPI